MTRTTWFRLGAAAAITGLLLLVLMMAALAAPQVIINFEQWPEPPISARPGMAEVFTWTITAVSDTPDRVEFKIMDPDSLVVVTQTYPYTSGFNVTYPYTIPASPKEGGYLAEVRYFSIEGGSLPRAYYGRSFYVANRGHLHVFKFDDFDGDGVQDPGDLPVQGVVIRMLTPFGDEFGQLTAANGVAQWLDIPVGSYRVTETVPAGREPTLPPTATVTVTLDATTHITFANRIPPSSILGLVWYDANGNGLVEPGETGLPNVAVRLYDDTDGDGVRDPGEPLTMTTSSGPTGAYTLSLVHAGNYVVSVDPTDPDLPIGYGVVGLPDRAVTGLAAGETRTVSFGFDDTGIVAGRVWNDVNGNGLIEPGEGALASIRVCLYGDVAGNGQVDPGDPLIGCGDSGPSGSYSFTGLAPGAYVADVDQADPDLPAGYVRTTADPVGVALLPGENLTINFGFRQPPTPTPTPTPTFTPTATPTATPTSTPTATPTSTATPTATPANSCIIGQKVDDLHVGLPGWTIHARPRDAQTPVYTTYTDGSGDFHFAGLTPGWWTVWEEMQAGWAPVTSPIFDVQLLPGPVCAAVRFKNRQACAQDLFEYDNTVGLATQILPNGVAQKHTLEPPADQDWLAFDARGGWVYTLRTDNLLGDTDTELNLFDTDGSTPLAYSDDIVPGADPRSHIIWRAPADGRYFARVQDYYQSGARGCLGYDFILTVQTRNHLPVIVHPALPTPTPTPTRTATPSRTPVPTATPTPTATRRPVVILPDVFIPGLGHPKGIGVDERSHLLYVASRDNSTLYQYDPVMAWVLRAIPTGSQPFGVGVNSTTHKVYVANFGSASLTVINGTTGLVMRTISFAPYGEPTYVAVNPVTNRVYVPLHASGRLAVIDGASDTLLTTLDLGAGGAFGVAVDPIWNRVYVSCRDAQVVRVIDGAANAILWGQTAYPGGIPYALGIDPGLGRLYVSFAADPADPTQPRQVLVYRIPTTGPSLLSTVHAGQGGPDGGGGIAANPDTHHVFVTNSLEDSVTVFDGVTLMVITTVPVGDDPMGVAVDPGLSYAFAGNRGSDSVTGMPDVY